MKHIRSLLVAATASSLLALPVAASAHADQFDSSVQSATRHASAATRYATTVKFLDFKHAHGYGSSFNLRGQVAVPALGGAVQGVKVTLYRKLNGKPNWHNLATKYTSHENRPKFKFPVTAVGNADYRVVFSGNKHLKPSQNAAGLAVFRNIGATIERRTARFHGKITPGYAHRTVYLDRRACFNCGWHRYRTGRTSSNATYSFKLTAPAHGKYYWRTSTPGSGRFIVSHSSVFATHR